MTTCYLNLIDIAAILAFKNISKQHIFGPIFTKPGKDHLQTNPQKTYLMYFKFSKTFLHYSQNQRQTT